MPAKRHVSNNATSPPRTRQTLTLTDCPGVYRNRMGVLVDEYGRALSFAEVKSADNQRFVEAVGAVPESPAALLRAVALDPRQRLDVRLHAARQAAPYYDKRQPIRIEGDSPPSMFDFARLVSLPVAERKAFIETLKKVGVEL